MTTPSNKLQRILELTEHLKTVPNKEYNEPQNFELQRALEALKWVHQYHWNANRKAIRAEWEAKEETLKLVDNKDEWEDDEYGE